MADTYNLERAWAKQRGGNRCETCGDAFIHHEPDGYCGDDMFTADAFGESLVMLAAIAASHTVPAKHGEIGGLKSHLEAIHDRLRETIEYLESKLNEETPHEQDS